MKTYSLSGTYLALLIFMIGSISCTHHRHHKRFKKESLAVIKPVNNSQVQGWVHFQKIKRKKVLVKAEITGLKPNKEYGFHIHKYGDCRKDGQKAGSHWNPKGQLHGAPDSKKRHWGDLGNLKANSKGIAFYEKPVKMCLYKTGGRSVIVHAKKDDLKSQPSGSAGPYIACGVIGYTQPKQKAKEEQPSAKKAEKAEKPIAKEAETAKESAAKENEGI